MSCACLELVAEHGLLREDLDLQAIAYAFLATFEGSYAQRRDHRQYAGGAEVKRALLALEAAA